MCCTNIYTLHDTDFLNEFVITMFGIQFVELEIKKLNFVVTKEHYRIMCIAQVRELAAVKGKKGKN